MPDERDVKSPKVGSDRREDAKVGGKLDFGIPADKAQSPQPIGGRNKGPEQGTGPTRSGSRAIRDVGVGHPTGPSGAGSGGDLDPDWIGLDGSGVAADPRPDRTSGPDMTDEGGSAPFASGGPARPNQGTHHRHGGPTEIVHGSTVDRSGGDASTTGPETGSDTTSSGYRSQIRPDVNASTDQERENDIPDNAAAGEITSDEAGGQGG